jgi:hypothetical protein
MRPAHRVAALFDVAQDLVEDGIGSAMGGDDFQLAAPRRDRLGHAIEQALIGVEREFVQDHVAMFTGERIGIRAEREDLAAIGETEHVTGAAVCIKHHFAAILRDDLDRFGPTVAIFEKKTRLHFVARGDPDIEAGLLSGGAFDGRVSGAEGDADLARFLDDFQGRSILNPAALVAEEVGRHGALRR